MKNGYYTDYKLFAGNGNIELAEEIAQIMGKPLSPAKVSKFNDGEVSVTLGESVRGADCYIIQSTGYPVNDNLMELCIMIDAMKRASAGRINAVIPYFGYARQDRISKPREPLTAKLVSDIISVAGADRVITMDLHAAQIQGYFNIPVDHMVGQPTLVKYFQSKGLDDLVIVSPDHGSVKRAMTFKAGFDAGLAIIDKDRPEAGKVGKMEVVGNVEGKNCILVDDMVDTAGTICKAANLLVEKGAKSVYACATHGVLSGKAIENLKASKIREIVFLNTVPVPEEKRLPIVKVLSAADVFAETISRVYNNEPLTPLFDQTESTK